jgi:hypothetical protein
MMGAGFMRMSVAVPFVSMHMFSMGMGMMSLSMVMGMDMAAALLFRSMQIFHVVVMVLMRFVQMYQEIAGIQPGFFYPADLNRTSFHRKACDCFFQYLLVGS